MGKFPHTAFLSLSFSILQKFRITAETILIEDDEAVILEPLGISKEKLLSLAESAVQNRMEITAYDDRKEDLQTLIERSKDADALDAICKEHQARALTKNEKPSVLAQLKKFKEIVAAIPKKVREKKQERDL